MEEKDMTFEEKMSDDFWKTAKHLYSVMLSQLGYVTVCGTKQALKDLNEELRILKDMVEEFKEALES